MTLALMAVLALAPEAVAQDPLPVPGQVTYSGNPIRAEMQLDLEVPLGATLYTLRRVPADGREVGVVTGVYRVVETRGLLVRAQPASGEASGAAVGDGVEVASTGTSTLHLDSVPTGASITWNGWPVGATPDTLRLAPGDYSFELRLDGYDVSEVRLDIREGTIRDERVLLDAALAALTYYQGGEAHFYRNEYDEAVDKLTQAVGVSDGSLRGDQITLAYHMLRAAGRMQEVAARARQAEAPEAKIKEAAYALKNVYAACQDNDAAAVQAEVGILKAALPTDPFVISFQACAQ